MPKSTENFWDKEKEKKLIELFQTTPKKEICKILNVKLKYLGRKIRELRLEYSDSFACNYKVCTKCKKILPRTKEFFGTNKDGNSTLFRSSCKECSKRVSNENHSSVQGYIKSLLYAKKQDKREFEGGYEIDIDFLIDLYNIQEGKCAISGIEMTHIKGKGFNLYNISIDRINPLIGYTKLNTQLVCLWANVSKNYLTMDEFKKFINLTFINLNSQNNAKSIDSKEWKLTYSSES